MLWFANFQKLDSPVDHRWSMCSSILHRKFLRSQGVQRSQYSKALENPGYQGSTSWLLALDLSQLLGHPSGTQERTRLDRTDLNQCQPHPEWNAERDQICQKNSSHLCKWHGNQRGRKGSIERTWCIQYTLYMLIGVTVVFSLETWTKLICTSAPIQAQWPRVLVGPKEKGRKFG